MNERNCIYTSAVGQCLLRDLDKGGRARWRRSTTSQSAMLVTLAG